MSTEPTVGAVSIPVQLSLPSNLLGPLHYMKISKGLSDSEFAAECVQFCIRLLLDQQTDTSSDERLTADLNRAVLDVRKVGRTLLDLMSATEKSLADSRAFLSGLKNGASS